MFIKIRLTALLALLLVPSAWAGREAYDVKPDQVRMTVTFPLNWLEPAAGPAAEVPAEPTAAAAAAPAAAENSHGATESSGHDSGHGSGHGGAEKPKPKKQAGPPPLPAVQIGGRTVRRAVDEALANEDATLPPTLRDSSYTMKLRNRISFTPFVHQPRLGPNQSSITIVVFEDLGCAPCKPDQDVLQQTLAPLITSLQTSASPTVPSMQIVWAHAPSSRWQGTNLNAFYSKVAARQNRFWDYRTAILANPDRQNEAAFGVLSSLGIEPRHIRQSALSEARRFYRELDADTTQSRNLVISGTPTVLVNGIRLGDLGLPLTLLPDVLTYVNNRLQAGLTEPPL